MADRGDEGHICARAAKDVGDIIRAAADGKALGLGMQVFLSLGQMIDTDDHVHAGGAENKYILHVIPLIIVFIRIIQVYDA